MLLTSIISNQKRIHLSEPDQLTEDIYGNDNVVKEKKAVRTGLDVKQCSDRCYSFLVRNYRSEQHNVPALMFI